MNISLFSAYQDGLPGRQHETVISRNNLLAYNFPLPLISITRTVRAYAEFIFFKKYGLAYYNLRKLSGSGHRGKHCTCHAPAYFRHDSRKIAQRLSPHWDFHLAEVEDMRRAGELPPEGKALFSRCPRLAGSES